MQNKRKGKVCYIDFETTGLEAGPKNIWQVAAIIDVDGEEKESINLRMRPYSMDGVQNSDYALRMNSLTVDLLNSFPDNAQQFAKFKAFLGRYVNAFDSNDKFLFAAYDAQFDWAFAMDWFKKQGDKYFFSWFEKNYLCTKNVAVNYFRYRRPKPHNYKLETVSKFLGIANDKSNFHDALFDTQMSRQVDIKLSPAPTEPF